MIKRTLRVDLNSHYFVVTAAYTDTQKADVLKGVREKRSKNYEKNCFTATRETNKIYQTDKVVQTM